MGNRTIQIRSHNTKKICSQEKVLEMIRKNPVWIHINLVDFVDNLMYQEVMDLKKVVDEKLEDYK